MSRYNVYFICKDTRLSVQHFHKCYTLLQVDYLQITQQASDLLSISEKYTSQHSSSLWDSINFKVLSSPAFNKPLIFYLFQRNLQPIIHQASGIISLSEHYTFRALSILAFIKPLVLYRFQSIIQTSIRQASDVLSILEQYTQKVLHSTLKKSNSFLIHSIQNMKP